ncbi:MAG: 4Fe-4S dicluster domain-containing protein [Rhodobacteraceae bacterium]|nr:4Fe-4S dicluster domain-containing protein [Paracoccaceae bacterium]
MTKRLVLCSCEGSQAIDAQALAQATGFSCSKVYSSLCYSQQDSAAKELSHENVLIACGQEIDFFQDLAEELEANEPDFIDLRDRAGWSVDEKSKAPKMVALLADAQMDLNQQKSIDVISHGACFIFGEPEAVLRAAESLKDQLALTLLLENIDDAPDERSFDVMLGSLRKVRGALGGFQIEVDQAQFLIPSGKGAYKYGPPKDGGQAECDIVLDLSGATPKVAAPDKREGYLRADPKDPIAVARAILEAGQLIGTFEKPLYVNVEEHLCAHSRAETIACSNCLNICPTGAISPQGEHVVIDPMICAGCGACSAVCPSGAISYDAPSPELMFLRLRTLSEAYRSAGGIDPSLLVVDDGLGSDMLRASARYFGGLPADCIPLTLGAVSTFGHAEIAAAFACGFASVDILLTPGSERDAFEREIPLAEAICGPGKIRLLEESDPEALSDLLFERTPQKGLIDTIIPMGSRRQVTRTAAQAIHDKDTILPLPANAPYGAVLVNTDTCTLCLSCVSLCPSGALADNPDKPELRFQEDACLQCGLCANICPEKAIVLKPQLNLTDTALSQVILNEEDPFACIECGALFGVKSTVERILEKLSGKHAMFASEKAAQMIQMCDKCRVGAQFHIENNPFAGDSRPKVRTTEDYLSKRKDH